MQNASARLRPTRSARSNRPIRSPIFPRRTVTGLSAMICDLRRNPFSPDGSMVTRRVGHVAEAERRLPCRLTRTLALCQSFARVLVVIS